MTGSTYVLAPYDDACPELDRLVAELLPVILLFEGRSRRRRPDDERAFKRTLRAMIASIAMIATMDIPPPNGLPLTFDGNRYTGSGVSIKAMRVIRDALEACGFLRVTTGNFDEENPRRRRVSRLKPTNRFVGLARSHGLMTATLIRPPEHVTVLREPIDEDQEMPSDVLASEAFIRRINATYAEARITLPEDAAQRVIEKLIEGLRADPSGEEDGISCGYDQSAIYLRRSFKHTWTLGGRFYGGYWINAPEVERKHILIDGEATVERDFKTQHPALLYARKGIILDFDPYMVPGYPSEMREEGKRTFNRLINGKWRLADSPKPKKEENPLKFEIEDKEFFESRKEYRDYVRAMRDYNHHIEEYMGLCLGLELQYEDSRIALRVMERCLDQGILPLPVHDSFICKIRHDDDLKRIMAEELNASTGLDLSHLIR